MKLKIIYNITPLVILFSLYFLAKKGMDAFAFGLLIGISSTIQAVEL